MDMSRDQTSTPSHSSLFSGGGRSTPQAVRRTGSNSEAQPPRDGLGRSVKRRATQACQNCRARKIRCDVAKRGAPCIHCRLDEIECVVPESRRRRNKSTTEKHVASSRGSNATPAGDLAPPNSLLRSESDEQVLMSIDDVGHPSSSLTGSSLARINSQSCVGPNLSSQNSDPLHLPCYIRPLPARFGEDDITYLQSKGALNLPSPELRTELLRSFIEFVHPSLPLLDWPDICRILDQGNSQHSISLLLYQSIMFSGVATVNMRFLEKAGFSSRREARRIMFTRARLLYDLDCEEDTIVLIQSLLLMTYFRERRHGRKETHHWIEIAVSLARKIGLNRNPEKKATLTSAQQRLHKRLWWCLYIRDAQVAHGTQGPPRIKDMEFDVPMLLTTDFDLDPLPPNLQSVPVDCKAVRDPAQQHELAVICIDLAKLALITSHILCVHYGVTGLKGSQQTAAMLFKESNQAACSQVPVIDHALQQWQNGLGQASKFSMPTMQDVQLTSVCLVLHRSWLHMAYYATLFCLHRPTALDSRQDAAFPGDQQPGERSLRAVKLAASQITAIAGTISDLNLAQYLPSPTITVLLPAIVTHLRDSLASAEAVPAQSLQDFCKCLQIMGHLREMYAAADYSTAFLQAAIDRTEIGPGTLTSASSAANQNAMMDVQATPQISLQMEASVSISGASQVSSPMPQQGVASYTPQQQQQQQQHPPPPQTLTPQQQQQQQQHQKQQHHHHHNSGRADSRSEMDVVRDDNSSSISSLPHPSGRGGHAGIPSDVVSPFERMQHMARFDNMSRAPQALRMFDGAGANMSNGILGTPPSGMMPFHTQNMLPLPPGADQSHLGGAVNVGGGDGRPLGLNPYEFAGMPDINGDFMAAQWMSRMGGDSMMMVDDEGEHAPN